MATKRTHTFTKRSTSGDTDTFKKTRIKELKSLQRSLTQEEIEELRRLMSRE